MNNLSLLIYFADVIGNIQFLCGFALLICFMAMMFMPPKGVSAFSYEHSPFDSVRNKTLWTIVIVCGLILAVTPSSNAIYMIAGSEAGEMVVTSSEGKEILGDIKDVIRTQLDSLKVK